MPRPAHSLLWTGCALACLLVVLSAGCRRPVADTGFLQEATEAPRDPLLAGRLGANDLFEVRVFQEPELSGIWRAGPDGTIDFPLCGRVKVDGRTPAEVADVLRACLADGYLRHPQVAVVPKEIHSKKVFVFGKVKKPGTFPFEENMSVIQAITLAGGFDQFAGANGTSVIRVDEEGRERKFRVPVGDIGLGRAPNFPLRPGDIIFVPESIY